MILAGGSSGETPTRRGSRLSGDHRRGPWWALLAVVTLSEQTVLPLAADTLDMWTMLALILTLAILLFHLNRQYRWKKNWPP